VVTFFKRGFIIIIRSWDLRFNDFRAYQSPIFSWFRAK